MKYILPITVTVAVAMLVYFGFYHKYTYEIHYKPKQHQSVAWLYLTSSMKIAGIRGCNNMAELETGERLEHAGWFECDSAVSDSRDNWIGGTLKLRDHKDTKGIVLNRVHDHYEPRWP
jgi:hypothetical protein